MPAAVPVVGAVGHRDDVGGKRQVGIEHIGAKDLGGHAVVEHLGVQLVGEQVGVRVHRVAGVVAVRDRVAEAIEFARPFYGGAEGGAVEREIFHAQGAQRRKTDAYGMSFPVKGQPCRAAILTRRGGRGAERGRAVYRDIEKGKGAVGVGGGEVIEGERGSVGGKAQADARRAEGFQVAVAPEDLTVKILALFRKAVEVQITFGVLLGVGKTAGK